MCERRDRLLVSVPEYNRETKEVTWSEQEIDRCLVKIIKALNAGGIYTKMCCCGHGDHRGSIELFDGRIISISDGYHYPGSMGPEYDEYNTTL